MKEEFKELKGSKLFKDFPNEPIEIRIIGESEINFFTLSEEDEAVLLKILERRRRNS